MQLFHFSETRLGAICHALFYLTGIPIFLENSERVKESNLQLRNGSNEFYSNSSKPVITIQEEVEDSTQEKCFGEFGCIKMRYSERRGFHLHPELLEEILPTVCLYNKKVKYVCQFVDLNNISRLEVTESAKSYWIIHGYMENGNRPWIKEMVYELMEYDHGANIFVLEWSQGAKPPYNQAVANVELIAAFSGRLLTILEEKHGLSINSAHLIGHSLGAHLCGLVGNWLLNNSLKTLGRISGLDPAQPYFQDYPDDARLNKDDAYFVDVIHTDARPLLDKASVSGLGLGTEDPSGHVDFYPNNGKDQPGCRDGIYQAILQEDGSLLYVNDTGIRRFLGCDHMRAYEYFTESIRSTCSFTGYACNSWEEFISLSCNISTRNKMGFHAKMPKTATDEPIRTNYFLLTASKAPFCRDHFVVNITLETDSSYRANTDLHLVLNGENGASSFLTIDSTELRGTGLTYKYLREGIDVGSIKTVILRPVTSNPLWWFVNRMGPKTADITVRSISLLHLENESNEFTFCPDTIPSFSVSDQNPSITLATEFCNKINIFQ